MINLRLFALLVNLLFIVISLSAQNTQNTTNTQAQKIYHNEWIDFEQTYYKIKVHKEGIYRIPKSVLENKQIATKGSAYKMIFAGKEIPIYVSNENTFTDDDFIEFYGNKLNGDFDTQLFKSYDHQLHAFESLFTDTATYFLTVDSLTEHLRYTPTSNNLENAPEASPYFLHQSVHYTKGIYSNGVGKRFSGVNVHFSEYEEGEGFMGDVFSTNSPDFNNTIAVKMPTPYLYKKGPAADIELKVLGLSDDFFTNNDHTLQVKLNEEEIIFEKYEGYTVKRFSIDNYPLNRLTDTTNNIFEVSALGFASSIDRNALSYITIEYPRTFNFYGLNQFAFTLPSNGVTTDLIEIENFELNNNAPILLDIENGLRMQGIVENNKTSFHLPISKTNNRSLVVYQNSLNTINEIKHLTQIKFKDFSQSEAQGNFVIISHPNLMGEGYVEDYAKYRTSEAGGNYKTIVADVNLLYDQFAWGIQKHPMAIKNLIDYAIDQWQTKPENLLLIGKSIRNSLCRNDSINWKKNLVPTYGESPSDWQFGKYEKSELPEIAVGRISASQPEDVLNYLNKVKQYETSDIDYCDAEALSWKKEVLQLVRSTVSWDPKPTVKFLRTIKDSLYGANITCINYLDTIQQDSLQNLLDQKGFGLISFQGYSNSIKSWDYDIGAAEDYTDQNRYPFMYSNAILTGDVHQPALEQSERPSMSEEWVLAKDAGAIAYLGGVEYGFPPALDEYGGEMFRQLAYKNYNQPIGKSILNTIKNIYRDNEGIQITLEEMNLQGDPAIVVNYMSKPEFEIKANYIVFEPDTITNPLDSIQITLQLINAGTYNLTDTIQLCIERKDAEGNVVDSFTKELLIANKTIFTATLFANEQPIQASDSYTFHIDCNDTVEENCEENNIVETSLFMVGIEENTDNPNDFDFIALPEIYPIPATNQFQLSVHSKIPQALKLACYHINGSLMMQQNENLQTGTNQFSFDVENLQSGTYLIKIGTANRYLFRKLVKH